MYLCSFDIETNAFRKHKKLKISFELHCVCKDNFYFRSLICHVSYFDKIPQQT